MLEVKNIYKSFGCTEVLKGINFTLEKGQVLAIIGSSGSGKTTLLRCLNFLEKPDVGQIIFNGDVLFNAEDKENFTDAQIRQKRLHFGLVFQSFNLFPQYNVFENICLAPRLTAKEQGDYKSNKAKINAEIETRATELLQRVGLSDKKNAYPCELSGGQQQRVAIARALAQKPDILCFDEPTSALDPELTGEVLRVIKGLKSSDSTMIVVTHEMNFARNVADKIIFMSDGVIEEEGTPQELFKNPKSKKTIAFLSNQYLDN
jgi:polar amino acid transport system ATP-binding protein